MKTTPILGAGVLAAALLTPLAHSATGVQTAESGPFSRIASFPVFLNTAVAEETVAEIVAASVDGNTLIYTDGLTGHIGFVDITDSANPVAAGVVSVSGEPTSVAVLGNFALAAVNTSADYVNTSGDLVVIDITTRQIVRTIALGGQPDAVAISPDGLYAAIAIENERDEDLGNGAPPQLPAGFVVIVDLVGPAANWATRQVDLVGIADLYPDDPEPEFVDINSENYAVVTLQENNHLVVIRLEDGAIVEDFSAGFADLVQIDTEEDDLIEQNSFLAQVPREPDAVAWTSPNTFVTADEGDLDGGSRGFTTFYARGFPIYQAGRTVEHQVACLGHYPESRSENKGCEPEGVEFGDFGALGKFLFVGAERSNTVLVYELVGDDWTAAATPEYVQTLPTGVGPEGLLAIPQRGLFVVASEGDARGDKYRSVISIYSYEGAANYPTIVSDPRSDGTPIAWGALSGLSAGPAGGGQVYTVHDSYYRSSRIFELDVDQAPATLKRELVLHDDHDVLRNTLTSLKNSLPGTADFEVENFFNADGSVNLDIEGIAAVSNGFWLASEGAGNLVNGVSDADDRPFESPNLILGVSTSGNIRRVIYPRLNVIQNQLRFGFEGVAVHDGYVYVCFQRAWGAAGDPSNRARIARYSLAGDSWQYAYYPLDAVASPAGGWVGLSEITHLGAGQFAILERDDQAGTDAAVKRIYRFDSAAVQWRANSQVPNLDVIAKELVRDLLVEGDYDITGGAVPEKLEGLCVLPDGRVLLVNDNDGVEDNNGETQLLDLGELFLQE